MNGTMLRKFADENDWSQHSQVQEVEGPDLVLLVIGIATLRVAESLVGFDLDLKLQLIHDINFLGVMFLASCIMPSNRCDATTNQSNVS